MIWLERTLHAGCYAAILAALVYAVGSAQWFPALLAVGVGGFMLGWDLRA